jgi:hypothetical protein
LDYRAPPRHVLRKSDRAGTRLLQDRKEFLKEHAFFLDGDSAYNLESFLLIPYSQAAPQSEEDAYNLWQSNSRIHIECCFGGKFSMLYINFVVVLSIPIHTLHIRVYM